MRRAALPFLLVFGSITLYFLLLMGFGIYQRYPVMHFVACVVGSVWLIWLLAEERTWGRAVIALMALVLTAGYVWYTLDYSTYEAKPQTLLAEGQVIAGLSTLELADADGTVRRVLDPEDDRATLLVLYRGYW